MDDFDNLHGSPTNDDASDAVFLGKTIKKWNMIFIEATEKSSVSLESRWSGCLASTSLLSTKFSSMLPKIGNVCQNTRSSLNALHKSVTK